MGIREIESSFREKVGQKVRLVQEGLNRFRVFTPFVFDDGDHFSIVLRQKGPEWTLADEGHTFMHLTYELEERTLRQGTRNRIIDTTLSTFGVEDHDGELRLEIPDEAFGDALFAYLQALVKITDVKFLSRERIRSAFFEDFIGFMTENVPEGRRQLDYFDAAHDPEGKYKIDCRINHLPVPLFVFGVPNDDKCRDATISLLQFERWNVPHQSMAVFAEQEDINRQALARFLDVCGKVFSTLGSNRDRIRRFLQEMMGQQNVPSNVEQ